MNGFITIAIGDGYLQRAVAFALSARRFGYETILLYRDAELSEYTSFFLDCIPLDTVETHNHSGKPQIWEYKKLCYRLSAKFETCAFCDADSLVIKDPEPVFALANLYPIHTPGARPVTKEQSWAVAPGVSTREIADYLKIPHDIPIHTLNGGFLLWRRSSVAEKWFESFSHLFRQVNDFYKSRGLSYSQAREELCMALAFAQCGIVLPRTDTSVGIWDAHHLELNISALQFKCRKMYYWEGHWFSPFIAHFGGSSISAKYRECVEFLTSATKVELPLFRSPAAKLPSVEFNSYSISRQDYEVLRKFIHANQIRTVLEFGPGASTFCFAEAGCDVISYEYQDAWYHRFQSQFENTRNVTIRKYENKKNIDLSEIGGRLFDLAFVDSPVGISGKSREQYSRLNTCEAAARHTDRIMLHDTQRLGERNTLDLFAERGWTITPVDGPGRLSLMSHRDSANKTPREQVVHLT